ESKNFEFRDDEDMINKLAEEYMDHIDRGKRKNEITGGRSNVTHNNWYQSLLVSWMVTDLKDPKTQTVGGVWSGEYTDHGRALIHKNREGRKHEGQRIRPTNPRSTMEELKNERRKRRRIERIARVPPKVTPQLPKPEVKVEEKIVKAEVVEDHIEKIQDLQSYKQNDDNISTLSFGTTNKVGTLKTCEEIMGFNDDKDVKVDVKRKFVEDKVRREVFDVDEALDIENSRASSFQVRGIHVDKTKVNAVRDWTSPKTLPEVRNNKMVNAFQEEDELEYAEPLDEEADQVTYVVQQTLCSPKVSDSSQRNKIFQTKCLVKEKICLIIIDEGSCKNLVSKDLVKAFMLPTEPRYSPYQIGWIKKGPKLKVIEICKVPLAIGKHYNELVTCDVVDIKACHVLLGRPWQHDMNATHQENKTLVSLVASPKEFQAEREETEVSYALVVKGVEDVMENAIPMVIKPLLAEFGQIYTNVWLKQEMVCAQRRTWDPGIKWLKILKKHLEDKINDNAYVVDLPNTMSISKTFNVSDIYEFHSEDVNRDKHLRTSSFKERGNDEDMINKIVEEYMDHIDRGKRKNEITGGRSNVTPNK
ncbi:putative nucleotidyltransferase, ribonuclease H, partial [Tanacetum coccineum]